VFRRPANFRREESRARKDICLCFSYTSQQANRRSFGQHPWYVCFAAAPEIGARRLCS
ncbi:unnamed protein product, partial [Phaeothamnion confervicola]